ncbi:hypothetical protein HN592_04660 [Candidatus Woesearchaeota archaeon]|nr:hypothetical protein [Candidatus Woesearchaeota archaeon]MBT4368504.1 hypothetical protein [Candidatus Woesearchaeota archaeon]MBT4712993.1 hypothetical protein [Candidatus Woesearchaeota archaeon]MBT6639905.1 hypothetical protein [Candidatus Woesearchaeota archaeon]MBT7134077.1 hypothetical protein [Candidatus Woesearchaeota archaeon]
MSNCETSTKIGVNEIIYRVDFVAHDQVHESAAYIEDQLQRATELEHEDFTVTCANTKSEIEEGGDAFTAQGRKCYNHNFWACIGPDGELYPCGHRTYKGVPSYGSVLENDLGDLLRSAKRTQSLSCLPDEHCKFCSPSSLRRNQFMNYLATLSEPEIVEAHEKLVLQS